MFPRLRLLPSSFFLLILAVLWTGCSDPYAGRMEVSGSVTLEGKPLPDGSILFFPLDQQETPGGAPIVNGEYDIPRQNGLKPGKYLVRITSGDGKTMARVGARRDKNPPKEQAAAPGGSTNIVSMDRIPEEWNIRSKQEREVKANSVNRFNFDIPSANGPRKNR
jgi:hypothetical protein